MYFWVYNDIKAVLAYIKTGDRGHFTAQSLNVLQGKVNQLQVEAQTLIQERLHWFQVLQVVSVYVIEGVSL